MPRAFLSTHIVADQPSPRSGLIYTTNCLNGLINGFSNAPVLFGRLNDTGFILTENEFEAKLVGFDVVNDRLHVIIEAEEQVVNVIMDNDYIVRLLSQMPEGYVDSQPIDSMSVRALLLEREDATS